MNEPEVSKRPATQNDLINAGTIKQIYDYFAFAYELQPKIINTDHVDLITILQEHNKKIKVNGNYEVRIISRDPEVVECQKCHAVFSNRNAVSIKDAMANKPLSKNSWQKNKFCPNCGNNIERQV